MYRLYIDDVTLDIRLFTFPSAQGVAALSVRDSRPRPGNLLWLRRVNYEVLLAEMDH